MKFFRILFGIVLGYAAVALMVMVGMTLGAFLLGANQVFVGDSWVTSNLWNIFALLLSVTCAFFGGFTAAWWGGRSASGYGLAVALLVFGSLQIVVDKNRAIDLNPPPRPTVMVFADWSNTVNYARPPLWLAVSSMSLGVVGVVAGTRHCSRRKNPIEKQAQ